MNIEKHRSSQPGIAFNTQVKFDSLRTYKVCTDEMIQCKRTSSSSRLAIGSVSPASSLLLRPSHHLNRFGLAVAPSSRLTYASSSLARLPIDPPADLIAFDRELASSSKAASSVVSEPLADFTSKSRRDVVEAVEGGLSRSG